VKEASNADDWICSSVKPISPAMAQAAELRASVVGSVDVSAFHYPCYRLDGAVNALLQLLLRLDVLADIVVVGNNPLSWITRRFCEVASTVRHEPSSCLTRNPR